MHDTNDETQNRLRNNKVDMTWTNTEQIKTNMTYTWNSDKNINNLTQILQSYKNFILLESHLTIIQNIATW